MSQQRLLYARWILGLLIVAGLAMSGGGLTLLLRVGTPTVPILAFELAAGAILVVGILLVTGHSASRRIRELLAGAYWVHWTYDAIHDATADAGTWQRYITVDQRRMQRIAAQVFAWFLLAALAVLVVLLFAARATLAEAFFVASLLFAVGVGMGILLILIARWLAAIRRQRGGEVYIGRAGIYRPDGFFPLSGGSVILERVELRGGQRAMGGVWMLRFVVRSRFPPFALLEMEVPVPRGSEDEAQILATRFGVVPRVTGP